MFRSLLSPGHIRTLRINISSKFFCALEESETLPIPRYPVLDTWKTAGQINSQYYEYSSLDNWVQNHPGELNSPRPFLKHSVRLQHATDYWPTFSEELRTNYEMSFNKHSFEPNPENLPTLNKYLEQLKMRKQEYKIDKRNNLIPDATEEERTAERNRINTVKTNFPKPLYKACKQFLQDQRNKIPAEER